MQKDEFLSLCRYGVSIQESLETVIPGANVLWLPAGQEAPAHLQKFAKSKSQQSFRSQAQLTTFRQKVGTDHPIGIVQVTVLRPVPWEDFDWIESAILEVSARKPRVSLMGVRVVAVDDCDLNRICIKNALRDTGAVVETHESVASISAQSLKKADILIVDYIMPDINGLDFVRQLASDVRARRILLTALPASKVKELSELEEAFDLVLSKGSSWGTLRDAIENMWTGHKIAVRETESANEYGVRRRPSVLVDVDGLHRAYGRSKALIPIIEGFIAKTEDAAERALTALDSENVDLAHGILHSIKGSAGNLAANGLFELVKPIHDNFLEMTGLERQRSLRELTPVIRDTCIFLRSLKKQLAPTSHAKGSIDDLLIAIKERDMGTAATILSMLKSSGDALLEQNVVSAELLLKKGDIDGAANLLRHDLNIFTADN